MVECEEGQGGCGNVVRDGVQPGGVGGGGNCISEKFGGKLQLCRGAAVCACMLGPVKWPGNSYS